MTTLVHGDDGRTYIFGEDEKMARAACTRIPWMDYSPDMRAVGVATGPDADAKLLAVCVYHRYAGPREFQGETWFNSCELSFAAFRPLWARHETVRNLLKIPFNQYKVEQAFVVIPSINERSIRLVKGIGFTPRGTISRYFSKTAHACVFGLHRNQFRSPQFLVNRRPDRRHNGKVHSLGAAAA